MLGSLVRNLLLLPLNSLLENLSYPALLLFVLVLLGHSTWSDCAAGLTRGA